MIYVLVPARDEAATVGLLLWKVRQVFTAFNREYQLLVVNDGSTDATDEVLAPYARALPLTLITHRQPLGYANSLEALLRAAVGRSDRPRRDLAVTIQADFSDSPDDIVELVKRIEGGADVAVADGRARPDAPAAARLARRFLPVLVRTALNVPGVDDYAGTLRACRLAAVERLVREHGERPILTREGWAADLELLVKLSRHARRIESVPVAGTNANRQRPSRASPIGLAWDAFRAARALRGLAAMPVTLPPPAQQTPARHEHAAAHAPAEAGAHQEGVGGGKKRRHRRRGRGRGRGKGRGQTPGQSSSSSAA